MRRLIAWLAIPCCAALLAGWTTPGHAAAEPDPQQSSASDRVPVILIPGLLGSRLARAACRRPGNAPLSASVAPPAAAPIIRPHRILFESRLSMSAAMSALPGTGRSPQW